MRGYEGRSVFRLDASVNERSPESQALPEGGQACRPRDLGGWGRSGQGTGGPAWSDGEDRRTSSGISRCISRLSQLRAPGIWAGGTLGGAASAMVWKGPGQEEITWQEGETDLTPWALQCSDVLRDSRAATMTYEGSRGRGCSGQEGVVTWTSITDGSKQWEGSLTGTTSGSVVGASGEGLPRAVGLLENGTKGIEARNQQRLP